MFEITAKLVAEQDEISGWGAIGWDKHSWKYVINLMMKEPSIFSARRSTSFQILCCVLERSIKIQMPTKLGRKGIEWITTSQSYRDFDGISGEPTEFEWNIFPGLDTLQLYGKVKDLLSRLGETPENFTGKNSVYVDVQRHVPMKKNVWQMLKSYLHMQRSLV